MKDCKDLALQLFEHDDIDVIMGGGREFFVDRLDKRDLIQVIIELKFQICVLPIKKMNFFNKELRNTD